VQGVPSERSPRQEPDVTLQDLRIRLRKFAAERDWDQFHSPKNLAMALSVEAAELLEHFQWLSEDDSRNLPQATRIEVAAEIADVQIYLVRLADKLGIDILEAAAAKIQRNEEKYPADRVKGSSKKYTRYDEADGAG
jgi:dCTP diphosphatase